MARVREQSQKVLDPCEGREQGAWKCCGLCEGAKRCQTQRIQAASAQLLTSSRRSLVPTSSSSSAILLSKPAISTSCDEPACLSPAAPSFASAAESTALLLCSSAMSLRALAAHAPSLSSVVAPAALASIFAKSPLSDLSCASIAAELGSPPLSCAVSSVDHVAPSASAEACSVRSSSSASKRNRRSLASGVSSSTALAPVRPGAFVRRPRGCSSYSGPSSVRGTFLSFRRRGMAPEKSERVCGGRCCQRSWRLEQSMKRIVVHIA